MIRRAQQDFLLKVSVARKTEQDFDHVKGGEYVKAQQEAENNQRGCTPQGVCRIVYQNKCDRCA
jgi:hypothetical protein